MEKNQKCNINFTSQYVHIKTNSKPLCLNINEYIEQIEKYKNRPLYCNNNHELCFANGKKVKPYFRHKNSEDTGGYPMSMWHSEWQGNFPITEVIFKKINDKQIKERRADVLLNDFFVVELQHSMMNIEEVDNRTNDYKLHNKEIIWVIDGNKSILEKELNYSKRIYLEFISDYWKFESFINCQYIYIDINEKIYKIIPKNIKSFMIDVQQPILKVDFINRLLNNQIIFNNDVPYQCNLYIKQQGAGNGKTYGIIQMLQSAEFEHYKYFIYITKQHSAKYVIFSELKNQIETEILQNLRFVSDLEECEKNSASTKKYIIKFLNLKTNNYCEIIIGTIDSFMYCLGNKNINNIDKFQGIVNSIIDNHIETKTKNGTISYGGANIILNKETILVGDEYQDPTNNYAKAIIQIMRNRYIDAYIVGDKLQSISIENNAFTYLLDNDFSNINKTIFKFTNVCRRFNKKVLIGFVNNMIPYDKFNLPSIELCENSPDDKDSLVIFEGEEIYNYKQNECKINDEVYKIMKLYINEVEATENNKEPNDFLIVTTFTRQNILVDALELAINIYWTNRKKNNVFTRYAIFHKSEQGTSIDLSESENSTRIVSIHSAKGDGRNVVFVIGVTEQALIKFSGESENLIYYSLLNVAITRTKQKLYFRFVNNSDHIARRIQNYVCDKKITNVTPNFQIYNLINYNKDLSEEWKKYFESIKENIIDNVKLQNLDEEEESKKIIDMSHHNIRYSSALINLLIQIVTDENKDKNKDIKKQIKAILHKIVDIGITITDTWRGYNILLKDYFIPILKITDKGLEYVKYFDIILNIANNILTKIKKIINSQNNEILCPIECIILYYMIETSKNGKYTCLHILDIYNIIDIYSKAFENNLKNHDTCLCSKYFNETIIENKTNKILSMQQYISSHYENINKISDSYKEFCKKYTNVNWLYKHKVTFNGENYDYEIKKYFELIGYDENNVIICYIKPQLNDLNYNDTLLISIFDTFLLKNIKKNNNEPSDISNNNNFLRFYNKKITTVIFTTSSDKPYYIDWTNEEYKDVIDKNSMQIKYIISNGLFEKYKNETKSINYFYKYWRENLPENISSSLGCIEYIIDKYNEIKQKNSIKHKEFPYFISDFFNNIKFSIENCENKKEKKKILQNYDDPTFFFKNLENKIKYSINRYLGMKNIDNDNDDTSDDE